VARIDWSKIPKDVKDKIHWDIYDMDPPCNWQGVECPMDKYGIDCDRDNDNHCAVRDFIFHCLEVRKCKQQ
jgi:hypothetical protein